ncbi:MAG: transcriptional regulator, partial [Calditrichaeota bacterium]|nr:transcriptional regulator [Calditrichota bacterium]
MNESELKNLISRGEDFHTEFKGKLPNRESLAKTITCFANSDGGKLVVGISDEGKILGVSDLDGAMRAIDDVAYNRCSPPITVVQETVPIDGKTVLVVHIPKGTQRPYRTRSGQFYVRSSNRCRQASREEMLRMFQAVQSVFYDETPVAGASDVDVDWDSFKVFLSHFLELNVPDSDLKLYFKNLRLWSGEGFPTMAGILFFGKQQPQKFFPHAKIICAAIPGNDLAIPPFDRKDMVGTIPEMIDDTQKFLNLYLREKHVINGFESEREPELPPAALREAVVNTIAHRDYTIHAPIRILLFEDRVEFHSPGKLPNTVTIESIRIGGAHVLRNPTIYNLLYKMGLVTDLGSGVRRIIYLIQKHVGKDLDMQETDSEFILALP